MCPACSTSLIGQGWIISSNRKKFWRLFIHATIIHVSKSVGDYYLVWTEITQKAMVYIKIHQTNPNDLSNSLNLRHYWSHKLYLVCVGLSEYSWWSVAGKHSNQCGIYGYGNEWTICDIPSRMFLAKILPLKCNDIRILSHVIVTLSMTSYDDVMPHGVET